MSKKFQIDKKLQIDRKNKIAFFYCLIIIFIVFFITMDLIDIPTTGCPIRKVWVYDNGLLRFI